MDKKKTGNLIREARTKKNYTQNELGDLLGVSNKSVSRWENGESFPDVGILENLSGVLDLQIKDIVIGETDSNEESAVTEVVRVAKLQTKEKKRKLISSIAFAIILFFAFVSGYSSLSSNSVFMVDNMVEYILLMLASYVLAIIVSRNQKGAVTIVQSDYKIEKVIAVLSLAWCVIVTGIIMISVANGYIPFDMEPSLVGPFVNLQLIIIVLLNVVLLVVSLARYIRNDEMIHWGYYVSVSSLYVSVLYGDLLHRLSDANAAIRTFFVRTVIDLGALMIVLIFTKVLEIKKK